MKTRDTLLERTATSIHEPRGISELRRERMRFLLDEGRNSILDAIDRIEVYERNNPKAQMVTRILGPETLRCSDRIIQQMRYLTHEAREKIDPDFLKDVVWKTYAGRIQDLLSILTTDVIHFIDGMKQLPQGKELCCINKSSPEIQAHYFKNFLQKLGPFIFVNLLSQEDLGAHDLYRDGMLMFLGNTKDHTQDEFRPTVGIGLSEPIGKNLSVEDQKEVPSKLSRVTNGHTHQTLGRLGLATHVQQAMIANTTLLRTSTMRVAATNRGIGPISFSCVRAAGSLLSRDPCPWALRSTGHAYAIDMVPLA